MAARDQVGAQSGGKARACRSTPALPCFAVPRRAMTSVSHGSRLTHRAAQIAKGIIARLARGLGAASRDAQGWLIPPGAARRGDADVLRLASIGCRAAWSSRRPPRRFPGKLCSSTSSAPAIRPGLDVDEDLAPRCRLLLALNIQTAAGPDFSQKNRLPIHSDADAGQAWRPLWSHARGISHRNRPLRPTATRHRAGRPARSGSRHRR